MGIGATSMAPLPPHALGDVPLVMFGVPLGPWPCSVVVGTLFLMPGGTAELSGYCWMPSMQGKMQYLGQP